MSEVVSAFAVVLGLTVAVYGCGYVVGWLTAVFKTMADMD